MKIKPEDIVERYEEVERMMLDDFFTFESVWGKFFFWIVNLLIGGFAGGYIGKLFF
ncbi:hypothetical protein B808_496 [Fructilactobacillus florum 8D]|uniref:Uncharacterized protein n=2 Tax=Fructilactobacillus florum TaxID=640331 RepID=W9ELP0_9LACO|nr:hypothetical protein B807_23 [Fructilactobacillus florum 2F]ETO40594.1 hypothetical protein B808_496 [Fructilactobacillus florum 8D]